MTLVWILLGLACWATADILIVGLLHVGSRLDPSHQAADDHDLAESA